MIKNLVLTMAPEKEKDRIPKNYYKRHKEGIFNNAKPVLYPCLKKKGRELTVL